MHLKKKLWGSMAILTFLVAGYAVVQYFVIGADRAGLVISKLMAQIPLNSFWYAMLAVHIAASAVSLVIGPFTLSASFRERNLQRHRNLGKLYMLGILFGGGSGLYLALYASGGLAGKLGFGTLSVLWLISAYRALHQIKHRKVLSHQKWMIRNYSLTFAAVTLRIWLPLFVLILGPERFDLSYSIISWLAWVPNLLLAEIFVRRKPLLPARSSFPK